ncbi:prolyl hydroxylase family protein [Candidatus Uabimicrobium amorphum]|uniref:Prolyl 4-hydroxylase subunit alpha n=1 Tax=Uabimicrobium amorphum TaxID=2596890 RepID=A0A5S9IIU9_UABAM|nr:2OG-Fe(II) oxygenase [Candidatus Uabimicrobium amorphum]BBM82633.1 prolyl 4-hydroxylase subunit alpha [Candidatus Uabimicrobium amorphum]
MQKTEFTEDIFTVTDVLSPEECQKYIDYTENIGFADAPITTAAGPIMSPGIRNNTRVMFDNEKMADKLWQRVQTFLPQKCKGRDALGLNERFRFYRYEPGQRFAPHGDGYYQRENGERSFFTFMVYLNDDCEGGETKFFFPLLIGQEDVVIKPKAGMALFFKHAIIHEGTTVVSGKKYVLRSDVMYSSE